MAWSVIKIKSHTSGHAVVCHKGEAKQVEMLDFGGMKSSKESAQKLKWRTTRKMGCDKKANNQHLSHLPIELMMIYSPKFHLTFFLSVLDCVKFGGRAQREHGRAMAGCARMHDQSEYIVRTMHIARTGRAGTLKRGKMGEKC